jgi:methylthioribose-1-phosphate isomerase
MDVPEALQWVGEAEDGVLRLLDQTQLPGKQLSIECNDVASLVAAIQRLSVRGAPAIGIAAAYGCVMGARAGQWPSAADRLAESRPTAVNLFWALDRMRAMETDDPEVLLAEARRIHDQDRAMCEAIGQAGEGLIREGSAVMTHCNAGALATGGIGTATAPMYVAHRMGCRFKVYADETRPLWQGARLTAWELQQGGIDVSVLCDGAAGSLMARGMVDLVITGADRIAANGDAANKIGTYGLAVLAAHHGIPFYIAAPASTFDPACTSGDQIPIEQRGGDEVALPYGQQVAPEGVPIENPAFDVTPAALITGLITDRGILATEQIGQLADS